MQELKQKFPAELYVTKVSLMEFYKHSSIDEKICQYRIKNMPISEIFFQKRNFHYPPEMKLIGKI